MYQDKIKALTKAAMYTAIVGALLLLNSMLGFIFESAIALFVAVLMIVYLREYDWRYGLLLALAMLVVVFLWGGIYVLLYYPLSIIAAFIYSFCLRRGFNAYLTLLATVVVMTLGEFGLTLIVLPLFGYSDLGVLMADVAGILDSLNLGLTAQARQMLIQFIFTLSLGLTALFEALIIHMASLVMFRRFRFSGFAKVEINSLKLSPLWAYILLAGVFLGFVLGTRVMDHAIIYYGLSLIGFLSAVVLCFEGYIFILFWLYLKRRMRYNLYFLVAVILLLPYSLAGLLITGFLYASGPLDAYLKRSVNS